MHESQNDNAYVLEVGILWRDTLNFLLNPTTLLLQNKIAVEDPYFYNEY